MPELIYVEAIVMPNGEIIRRGKTLGQLNGKGKDGIPESEIRRVEIPCAGCGGKRDTDAMRCTNCQG